MTATIINLVPRKSHSPWDYWHVPTAVLAESLLSMVPVNGTAEEQALVDALENYLKPNETAEV